MCELRANQVVLDALRELERSGETQSVKRLVKFAEEADAENAGPLDDHQGALRHFPDDLKHIRHYRFGKGLRHRIYLSGSNRNCFYSCWYVKVFKKSGTDDDGDKAFQNKLKKALQKPDRFVFAMDEDTDLIQPRINDAG